MKSVLVASGTANTGSNVVKQLSALGKCKIKALTRNPAGSTAKALSELPNVEVVKGDFGDRASLDSALQGVDRAFLVSQAGTDGQYDNEVAFIKAAADAGIAATVRISTCDVLISLDSRGVYARAHAKIEKFIAENKAKVIDLQPNWFMSNIYFQQPQVTAGTYELPCPPDHPKFAMVDPRDIAGAATAILMCDDAKLEEFLEMGRVQVHGPEKTSYPEQCKLLGAAAGKDIKFVQITPEAYQAYLMEKVGLDEVFAYSFLDTVRVCAGDMEPKRPMCNDNSPQLLSIWKPQYTLEQWCKDNGAGFQ